MPDVRLGDDGRPQYPIQLTSTAYIADLGRIVTDRAGFHTERYIYPAGFRSSRLYASTLDPTKRTRYTCEILDVGDQMPLFRVTMDENPDCTYEGNSPTSPWNLIVQQVLARRAESPHVVSVSGPEYYGLAAPVTVYLIQRMQGANQCVNYQMREFTESSVGQQARPPVRRERPPPKDIDTLFESIPPPIAGQVASWGSSRTVDFLRKLREHRALEQADSCMQPFYTAQDLEDSDLSGVQQDPFSQMQQPH